MRQTFIKDTINFLRIIAFSIVAFIMPIIFVPFILIINLIDYERNTFSETLIEIKDAFSCIFEEINAFVKSLYKNKN